MKPDTPDQAGAQPVSAAEFLAILALGSALLAFNVVIGAVEAMVKAENKRGDE